LNKLSIARRPLTVSKASIDEVIDADRRLTRLVFAHVLGATVWLVFGTLVGWYVSLKFLWPDLGVASYLSVGRLRPVHTNTVFWGFASEAMVGLAYYVVPRTTRRELYSYRLGWLAFGAMVLSVVAGNVCLCLGITNGAQEYREYVWPAMALFGVSLSLTLFNFYMTVLRRRTHEIYIANWYIIAALIWTVTLAVISYVPFWERGLGQTVIQGYYMHQGVGMWFTPMTLGLTYYFLPKLLNKPIYSYSLGVLAFWTQMAFYTMLGAHHFLYSAIPWWLQTVAILFSVGMVVPVLAGSANFLLTMRGSSHSLRTSYALPFLLVGVLFYLLGSLQGTFEALRSLNVIWHFTNYTVGHSHITMYGFVTFLIWGGVYALLPRLSAREPRKLGVGIHFWLALIGVLIYGVSLSIGGTLQGLAWLRGVPFIESVELMVPYWVARAVGGTLMFASHLVFAGNVWSMLPRRQRVVQPALAESPVHAGAPGLTAPGFAAPATPALVHE
jgi:cytochrome c oxidase cbb3-type subunit 1